MMSTHSGLSDSDKRLILDDLKASFNPAELTSDAALAQRLSRITQNVDQLTSVSQVPADLVFSVNLVDYASDCVATHLESSDPNRELFHELVIADEITMESWCPGGYDQLLEITKACIPVRIGFQKFINLKDLEERTRERVEEAPRERRKRGPNLLNKAPTVVPKKITVSESTQSHNVNLERAHHVLTQQAQNGPVPFFRFVINPRSFVQTVYNIFITSFLVHEQHAVLSVGDNHELLIQSSPETNDDADGRPLDDVGNIQLVASLNALEWKALVGHLKIKSAMLPEFCPKVSQYFQDNQLGEELADGVTFLDP